MKESVLFVDDEENILSSLKRGLIDEEYKCFFATSGKAALEIMNKNSISVLVTDMRMPEMDGLTLLKIAKEKYPNTVRIVLSGYTQLQQIIATINQVDIFKFITKPWKLEAEFKDVINQALEYYRLLNQREELKKSLENKNQAYQKILKRIDDVIANAKNDIQIARGAGIYTVDFIGTLLEKSLTIDAARKEFKSIRKTFHGIMNVIAAENKDTDMNGLLENYISYLKSRKQITNVDYKENVRIKTLNFKPEIIYFALEIVEEFINEKEKYNVKILYECVPVNPETNKIEIAVLISPQEDNSADATENNISDVLDEKIISVNKLFSEFFRFYKGTISAGRANMSIALKIQLLL